MFTCGCTITDSNSPNVPISIAQLIQSVFNSMQTYTMAYTSGVIKQHKLKKKTANGKSRIRYSLPCRTATITTASPHMRGIYFILSENKKKLLYIGKDEDVAKRLADHLIVHSKSKQSQMKNISNYLINQKRTQVQYCAIEVDKAVNCTIIEALLIDYCMNNKTNNPKLDKLFNKRK